MVLLRRLTGLSFHIVSHLQMLPPRGSFFRRQAILILKMTRSNVAATIVTNPDLESFLTGHCGHRQNRVKIIFNPVDFSQFRSTHERDDSAVAAVLMLAQWRAQKDHPTAIRAAAILQSRGVQTRWVLAGTEDDQLTGSARALIRELNLGDTVTIAGRRTDVNRLLDTATVGVLATHFEGLPVAILEYAAAGLPCVVSEVEGTRQIVDPDAGIIGVPEGDAEALANEVERLLADRSAARKAGVKARQKVQPMADTPAVMLRIRQLYDDVVIKS